MPELLGAMTAACCPLPPEERGFCAREQVSDRRGQGRCGTPRSRPDPRPHRPQLSQGIATLCATPGDAWRDPQGCCSWEEPERRRCFDNTYLSQVTLGAAVAPPPLGHEE